MKLPTSFAHRPHGRASLRAVVALALAGLVLLLPDVFSAPPAWWAQRGVLNATQDQNNYLAITVGQLKNIAVKAMDEMDAKLPDGAGAAIHTMVDDWRANKAAQNQFSAATVGQVKAVSKLYYDRLNPLDPLAKVGYPWLSYTPIAENYAVANVGQVKNLFKFIVPDIVGNIDSDGNGFPDWWELTYFRNIGSLIDSDGDGVPDLFDAFPFDPTQSTPPATDATDQTPPQITLRRPQGAVLLN